MFSHETSTIPATSTINYAIQSKLAEYLDPVRRGVVSSSPFFVCSSSCFFKLSFSKLSLQSFFRLSLTLG